TSYHLNIEIIEQTHTTTKDESKMEVITTNYHAQEIITGPGISKIYMKLIIDDEARYQFNMNGLYGILEGKLLNQDFNQISDLYDGSAIDLLPGTYYFETLNQHVSIGKIKYTKTNLNIQVIQHELGLISTPQYVYSSTPILSGTLSHSLQ